MQNSIIVGSGNAVWQLLPSNLGLTPSRFPLGGLSTAGASISTFCPTQYPTTLIVGLTNGTVIQYSTDFSTTGSSGISEKAVPKTLYQHQNSVLSMITASIYSSPYLFSGAKDNTIVQLSLWSGSKTVFKGHTAPVNSIFYLTDPVLGPVLYSASSDGTVVRWNPLSGEAKQVFTVPSVNSFVSVVANKKFVYGGADDSNIYRWDIITGQINATYSGHTAKVSSLALEQSYLYSGAKEGKVLRWDAFANPVDNIIKVSSVATITTPTLPMTTLPVTLPALPMTTLIESFTSPKLLPTITTIMEDFAKSWPSMTSTSAIVPTFVMIFLTGFDKIPAMTSLLVPVVTQKPPTLPFTSIGPLPFMTTSSAMPTPTAADDLIVADPPYWLGNSSASSYTQCVGYCSGNPCNYPCASSAISYNISFVIPAISPCYQTCDSLTCIFVSWINASACQLVYPWYP